MILTLLPGFGLEAIAQTAPNTTKASQTMSAEPPSYTMADDELELEDINLLEMEIPIVVTATRREQKITTVPYAVSIITAEDIRWSGARSVPDALRLVPGVDIAQLAYGAWALSPRGTHALLANQSLILVDGRQIFDSASGGTLWGNWPFQLEDIQRIEVIRGPGGVTWGANANQGVINIITKDPADQLGLTVTGGGGSRGTHKEHLGYAFAHEKLKLRISGEYEASDGFAKGGSILHKLEDDYKAGRSSVHAIYQPGPDDTITFSGGNALVDGGFPLSPNAGINWRRNAGSQASFILGKWSHQIAPDNAFDLTGYVNDFHGSNGIPSIDYRYQQLALLLNHTFKPAESHTLTWGLDTRTDLTDTTNADPFMLSKDFVSTAIIGLYIQDEWRFAPKWTLNLGGRIDYEFYGGFEPSARASLSYELTDTSFVYGAVSRAFAMPPAATRFLDIPIFNGLARTTSDRDIKAQTLVAYELGYRGAFFNRLETSANLFWHESDDLSTLSMKPGPPGLIQINFDDRGSSSCYGLELDAKYKLTDRLTLLGNYTFERLDWRASVPYQDSENTFPPKHKFMLGARYSPTNDLHLSSHLYYVDAVKTPNPANPFTPRRVAPYFRLDLRAEHEFWDDQASIAVGVSNLLDSNHYEGGTTFINDAEVPRMVYAEMRMTIR